MADTLSVTEGRTGGGLLTDTTTGVNQPATFGTGVLPSLGIALTHGSGNSQANKWYLAQRALSAGGNDDLDLAGGLTDKGGAAITFTAIKRLLVAIIDPDGTKSLRVGPANVANGWAAPWGGGGATVYTTVFWGIDLYHPYAGYAVTAGTGDILRITNPGAGSVTYAIWLIGVG